MFKSNTEGEVSFMKFWNKNQIISNGDFVFTVIPKNHFSYICKLQAPVLNSGKVKIGQDVSIKLSSYPDNEYGILKGKVKNISLVPNSEGLYLLDVSLPKRLITTVLCMNSAFLCARIFRRKIRRNKNALDFY